jgi:hypothetical protein
MQLLKRFNNIDFNHHENSIRYFIAGSIILSLIFFASTLVIVLDGNNWRFLILISGIASIVSAICTIVGLPLIIRVTNIHIIKRILFALALIFLCFILARNAFYCVKDLAEGTKIYEGTCEVQSKQSRHLITYFYLYPANSDKGISIDYETFETFDGRYNESTQRYQCNQEVRMEYLENNKVMIDIFKK